MSGADSKKNDTKLYTDGGWRKKPRSLENIKLELLMIILLSIDLESMWSKAGGTKTGENQSLAAGRKLDSGDQDSRREFYVQSSRPLTVDRSTMVLGGSHHSTMKHGVILLLTTKQA